jgi:hypothetical protein
MASCHSAHALASRRVAPSASRDRVRARAPRVRAGATRPDADDTPSSSGVGGFLRKLFTGELGVPASGPGSDAAAFAGSESAECAMLRAKVLPGTVLASRELVLAYDASRDGWSAAAFHSRCDNFGPAVLVARTAKGHYFGAFNPLGWASREDYRDAFNAFLVKWPRRGALVDGGEPWILEKVGGPGAAIFDFGAEGPIFGADALKIPLGRAPSMGSSYAQIGGAALGGGGKEIKTAKSSLGSSYAAPPDGTGTLFGPSEGRETELAEMRVYVGKGLEGDYA